MFNLRTRVASAARAASFKRRRVDCSTLADKPGAIPVLSRLEVTSERWTIREFLPAAH